MLSGVAKSGSPISRWTTWRPAASRRRALASTSNAPSVPSRSMRSAKRMPMTSVNPHERAAVHADGLARDVGGLPGAEEGADGAELGGLADPAGGDRPAHAEGVAPRPLPDASGGDRAPGPGVHPDAPAPH